MTKIRKIVLLRLDYQLKQVKTFCELLLYLTSYSNKNYSYMGRHPNFRDVGKGEVIPNVDVSIRVRVRYSETMFGYALGMEASPQRKQNAFLYLF